MVFNLGLIMEGPAGTGRSHMAWGEGERWTGVSPCPMDQFVGDIKRAAEELTHEIAVGVAEDLNDPSVTAGALLQKIKDAPAWGNDKKMPVRCKEERMLGEERSNDTKTLHILQPSLYSPNLHSRTRSQAANRHLPIGCGADITIVTRGRYVATRHGKPPPRYMQR